MIQPASSTPPSWAISPFRPATWVYDGTGPGDGGKAGHLARFDWEWDEPLVFTS